MALKFSLGWKKSLSPPFRIKNTILVIKKKKKITIKVCSGRHKKKEKFNGK